MCVEEPGKCRCPGHKHPGVRHVAPCCDEPHVEEPERYVMDIGFLSLPWEVQEAVNEHAAKRYAEEKENRGQG